MNGFKVFHGSQHVFTSTTEQGAARYVDSMKKLQRKGIKQAGDYVIIATIETSQG